MSVDIKQLDDMAVEFWGDRLVSGRWEEHEIRTLLNCADLNLYNASMKLRRKPSSVRAKRYELERESEPSSPSKRLERKRAARTKDKAYKEYVDEVLSRAPALSSVAPEPSGELIPLTENDGVQAVMGRDLHAFLEVKSNYREWFPRMVDYGFEEGKDYASKNRRVRDSLGREREATNHVITLDMAKEISMIQRTDKGKQARQYFIECERRAKQPVKQLPQDYASALRELASTVEQAELEKARADQAEAKVTELEPKAESYSNFLEVDGAYSWNEAARIIGVGRNRMLKALREQKVLMDKGEMKNVPYQDYMKHFEVKATTFFNQFTGTEHTHRTVYVKPSGLEFLKRKCRFL